MTIYSLLFYCVSALMVLSTAMAITRRDMVHAVLYLVLSFFGSAMLFYLLGAPFLAALEIIIYAGAIMVLFLFIIMMVRVYKPAGMFFPKKQLIPALVITAAFLTAFGILIGTLNNGWDILMAAGVLPGLFGRYVFHTHWLAVEIASLLLLVALIGAYLLGRRIRRAPSVEKEAP